MTKIAFVGDAYLDLVIATRADIVDGPHSTGHNSVRLGGSAAIMAVITASRHPQVRWVGNVGADAIGDDLCATMKAFGVEIEGTRQGQTGILASIEHGRGRHFVADIPHLEVPTTGILPLLAGCDWVHLTGNWLVNQTEALTNAFLERLAKAPNIQFSVDLGNPDAATRLGRARRAALIRTLNPNTIFADKAEETIANVTSTLSKNQHLVVTDGVKPVIVYSGSKGTTFNIPTPIPADVTTGAGDAFAAGVVLARSKNSDFPSAIKAGMQVAAEFLEGRPSVNLLGFRATS